MLAGLEHLTVTIEICRVLRGKRAEDLLAGLELFIIIGDAITGLSSKGRATRLRD